jgi:hypothetical protein
MTHQEEPAHSMCVSLRVDKDTLSDIESKQEGATLSATIGVRINNTLEVLAKNVKDKLND